MELGKDQKHALSTLTKFITNSDGVTMTLSGAAGTGKTFLVKHLIDTVIHDVYKSNYKLCAPTHKARLVLNKYTDDDTITVHTLLGLKPYLELYELDYKDLQFDGFAVNNDIKNGIIICDEASMINDAIYDKLVDLCYIQNNKLIFIGDKAQLQPVKANKISKVFDSKNCVELNEIFRQSEQHGALDYLAILRNKPIYNFDTKLGEDGGIIKTDQKEFLKSVILEYRKSLTSEDKSIDKCKVLAWTNKMVESYNTFIRKYLFPDTYLNMFNVGEIVTMYANTDCLYNSMDYTVLSVSKKHDILDGLHFNLLILELYDCINKSTQKIRVLDRDTNKDDLIEYISKMEEFRTNAITLKSIKQHRLSRESWNKYYEYFNFFLSPVDFKIAGRTIKQKFIDYGYACTVHKSQGSTYDNVYVDLKNIFQNKSKAELRQLEYVALSRARKNIYIWE